jgi:hypothetical protein
MAVGDPPLSCDDAKLIVFKDGSKLVEDVLVSGNIKPDSTTYKDKHIGNKTFKGDIRVWGWSLTLKYHYSSDELVAAMLLYYKALQTPGVKPPTFSAVLALQERNAAAKRPGYLFRPFFPTYDLELPGLEERVAQGLEGFAETWAPYKAT